MTTPQPVPYTPAPLLVGTPLTVPVVPVSLNSVSSSDMAWRPMDFSRPDIRRMVASFTGKPKTGKTHMSLATTPEPIFYANIDMGTEGVAHKMAGREIYEVIVRYKKGWHQTEYKKLWARLEELKKDALSGNKGTLVIDSETEDWELQTLAEFGKTDQIRPRWRGHLNTEKRTFINDCLASSMNVLFMSRCREIWLPDSKGERSPSGRFERRGYTDLESDLQVVGWTEKRFNPVLYGYDDLRRPLGGTEYGVRITDTRLKGLVEGQTYWGAMARFDMLLEMSWA